MAKKTRYVCTECKMESANGVNGLISLEECDDVVSDQDLVVVGYYMHSDIFGNSLDYDEQVKFSEYFSLSITLINKYNSDEQILVEGVEAFRLNAQGNYVAFSRAEVLRAMEEMGCSLSDYDVRLSFVPMGGGYYLDYGITFTDFAD